MLSADFYLYLYLSWSTNGSSYFFRQHNDSQECSVQVAEQDATAHKIYGSVFPVGNSSVFPR
jgi:hypothetical protein